MSLRRPDAAAVQAASDVPGFPAQASLTIALASLGWRREHALASMRACAGVLAFISQAAPLAKKHADHRSEWGERALATPGELYVHDICWDAHSNMVP